MNEALAAAELIEQINAGRFMLLRQPIQPIRDLIDTDGLSEICVRWIPEESGQTPTGTYLTYLDQTSLMPIVDRWVIQCISHLIQADRKLPWTQHLHKQYIIELSRDSIADPDTANYLHETVTHCRIPGNRLIIESSFEIVSAHPEQFELLSKRVRSLGCNICLYGTPAVNQLLWARKVIGARFIKLDLSGCRATANHQDKWNQITPLIKSCVSLGMKSIAQFIESPRLIPHLIRLGVDYVEGCDLSMPTLVDTRLETPFSSHKVTT